LSSVSVRELEARLTEPPDGFRGFLSRLSSQRASSQSVMNSFRLYLISDDIAPNPDIIVSL
jgi:hypothetical protein